MHTCVSLCVWVSVFNGSGNLLVDKIFLNQFTAKISTGEMQCIRLLTICRFEHMMGTIKTSPFFIGMDWLIISFSSLFLSFSRSLSEYSNMIYIFSKDFYSIITIFIHFYHYSLLLLFCSLFKYIILHVNISKKKEKITQKPKSVLLLFFLLCNLNWWFCQKFGWFTFTLLDFSFAKPDYKIGYIGYFFMGIRCTEWRKDDKNAFEMSRLRGSFSVVIVKTMYVVLFNIEMCSLKWVYVWVNKKKINENKSTNLERKTKNLWLNSKRNVHVHMFWLKRKPWNRHCI